MKKSVVKDLILSYLYENEKLKANIQFFNGDGIPEDFIKHAEKRKCEIDAKKDERIFRETFWELLAQNLVVIGSEGQGAQLPWVSITSHGMATFKEGEKLPYDPDGFLDDFYRDLPNLDTIVKIYFEEAVSCFSYRNYLATAVMIGGAIERGIIVMTEGFNPEDEAEQKKYKEDVLSQGYIKRRFENFLNFIKSNDSYKKLDVAEREKLNSFLPAIVNLIRITRNQTGHPTGSLIPRDEAQGAILLVKGGLKFMYHLSDLLKKS